MKTFAVVSLVALASVASAQLDNIPSCALNCFIGPLTSDGCSSLTDFACHCKQGTTLLASVQPCVKGACSAADQQTTINAVKSTCADAGVPIEIPDASSAASSAVASATSAAASAASSAAASASAAISSASSAIESAASSLSSAASAASSSAANTTSAVSSAASSATGSATASAPSSQFTGGAAQATQAAGLLGAAALAILAL
ncbi:CFEM-domain-containing protein [Macroventuria anomochaeta]|uniref:CFEM-domain-containing protein n=1 Tax=Macroventuria anomochaeta TaxID=301207 RepID=A0ACB6SG82_9PLEO|nr:CFEM-domain-containing protein [Macroventuria anomochaeta]KAF2632348.1 CFEM-domain-containing protein [Macroventuria anomochaeta]